MTTSTELMHIMSYTFECAGRQPSQNYPGDLVDRSGGRMEAHATRTRIARVIVLD